MTASWEQEANALSEDVGRGWNHFWFMPSSPDDLCLLRIGVGGLLCLWLVSFSPDLVNWFGPQGLLPLEMIERMRGEYKFSLFDYFRTVPGLWTIHAAGLACALALTVGFLTRAACIASIIVFLSYVHRAPMIHGQAEHVLAMLLLYLCLAPCGRRFSIDAARRRRRKNPGDFDTDTGQETCTTATIARRLIQLHLAGFYGVMALTKLAGNTWWNGGAAWWLLARSESRVLDLTWLHDQLLVINGLSHGMVLFEILFALLIWNRRVRPLLLLLAVPYWCFIGLVTGWLVFAFSMFVALLAFVPREWIPGEK